ncbi:phosphoribosyltransferase [Patescibacteria group bacterium]|nr:phosphoribosyltransferase [Patescibacteria group bacterium]MBU1683732.1 phosphoribosyltransferase [Patescibacteria group bacterium]MBU1934577.1 phosphoribosyltransferase [Patescibacteria group bacterium]
MYKDRYDAAKKLIPELEKYKGNKDAIILAIPRGALELGVVLRDELSLPLDIVVTKKIGAPGNEEYAIGSVGPDGESQISKEATTAYGIPQEYIDDEAQRLKHVIKRRYEDYRGDKELPDLKDKIVIVVDDGIATGFTTLAAVQYIRRQKAKKIVLAVPVAATDSYEKLKKEVDEMICLDVREDFFAVGQFYQTFGQVSDDEAKKMLDFTNRDS